MTLVLSLPNSLTKIRQRNYFSTAPMSSCAPFGKPCRSFQISQYLSMFLILPSNPASASSTLASPARSALPLKTTTCQVASLSSCLNCGGRGTQRLTRSWNSLGCVLKVDWALALFTTGCGIGENHLQVKKMLIHRLQVCPWMPLSDILPILTNRKQPR